MNKVSLSKSDISSLYYHGLPKNLEYSKPFNLEDQVHTFISEGERLSPKRFSRVKQMDFLEKVYNNPYFGPYVFCISGYPNDTYAKMLAALLMCKAFSISKNKSCPKWQNVYLGFDNPTLRDKFKPPLLILSNLTAEASNQKIDKLRDTLEYHCNIPRIVVCAGIDPIAFFNTKLHMQINGCVYLQGKQVKKFKEI
jgi:hypothetical protein